MRTNKFEVIKNVGSTILCYTKNAYGVFFVAKLKKEKKGKKKKKKEKYKKFEGFSSIS